MSKINYKMLAVAFCLCTATFMSKTMAQVTWSLNPTNDTLTISGSGAMADYDWGTSPWYSNSATITTVIIDNGVTTIGNNAFGACSSLTSVSIPNTVTTIGDWAFGYCSSLTSVRIPNSVTTIENYAFYYCYSLAHIYSARSIPPAADNSTFYDANTAVCIVHVPTSKVLYEVADGWKEFVNIVEDLVNDNVYRTHYLNF